MKPRAALAAAWVAAALAFLLAGPTRSLAGTYYVGPNGSNTNPGSQARPWATPGYGSRQLGPGDTLIILGGRYVLSRFDEDVITPGSGRAGAWIAIEGQAGHRPTLVGRDNLLTAVNLSGQRYVRLSNLEITRDDRAAGQAVWFRDGVQILEEPASHIRLSGLYVHHLDEFGLNFQDVSDLEVVNCRIEYCGFGAVGGPEAQDSGWTRAAIRRSRLSYSGHYYQGGTGAGNPYARPDGFGIEPSAGPVLIEDTIAEHNRGDGLDSKAARTTVLRCRVANNSCDGVKLWQGGSQVINSLIYGRGDGSSEVTPWSPIVIDSERAGAAFSLINVTVDDRLGRGYLMYAQYDTPDVAVSLSIRNAIFSGAGPNCPIFVGRASTIEALNNLFYMPRSDSLLTHGARTYTSANVQSLGSGNRYGDPRFVRPAWGVDGDYHLRAGSPAINAGAVQGAAVLDLEGRRRDARPDIGAYEYRP